MSEKKNKSIRTVSAAVIIFVLMIAALMLNLAWAPHHHLSLTDVWNVIIGRGTWANRLIVVNFNLPRVVTGMIVGSGLAVSGAVMQALFRNPMASPYILGLSSGAALGAAIGMIFVVSFIPALIVSPLLAFIFCFITMMLVYSLSRVGGNTHMETLLLAGIAVGAFISALVSFLTYIAGDKMAGIVFWSMGSLSGVSAEQILFILPFVVVGVLIMIMLSKELNVMMLGDAHAMDLGVNVKNVRFVLIICTTMVTAASVAFVGVIGFVGLVIPHIIRLLVGPDNRKVIPLSVIAGAAYLITCDYIAHAFGNYLGVGTIPIGIITAMVGGPYFIYLLRRRKSQIGWN